MAETGGGTDRAEDGDGRPEGPEPGFEPGGGSITRPAPGLAHERTTGREHGPLPPEVRIGHVHLKVSDLDRAIRFYSEVLGFELQSRLGDQAAFLSAGGYHHHIGLNTWESRGGQAPPPGTTGLYHHAILYPDRRSLAHALRRLLEHGVTLTGAADHGVSEAIYLDDPDGNGVELYRDRPRDEWPSGPDGAPVMYTRALDLRTLLAELG